MGGRRAVSHRNPTIGIAERIAPLAAKTRYNAMGVVSEREIHPETNSVRKPTRTAKAPTAAPKSDASKPERTAVQSLARAFGILEEVARNRDGISLAELGKNIGLHSSTTFHLVKTLTNLGYLRQIAATKRYRLGSPLYAAAAGARDEIELTRLVSPFLEDLSSQTAECCDFAVLCGDNAVILARTVGSGAFRPADRIGIIRPPHATALGKVLLAYLPPDRLDSFLQRTRFPSFTPRTIVDPEMLKSKLEEIRQTGISYDDGEFSVDLRCVAVPVHGANGETIGAMGLSGPVWQLTQDKIHQYCEPLLAGADGLSRLLRGEPPAT